MQTRIDTEAKTARYSFASLAELGRYIDTTPRAWPYNASETERAEQGWDLDAGYKGAVDMAKHGWIEGAQRSQTALKAFAPKTPAPTTRNDVYGFRPNVPRFCAGAPDCMVRYTEAATGGARRVLTLVVPVNANGLTSASSMANFGVAVAQYVKQLELGGTRVELIGAIVSSVKGWRVAHTFTVKRAEQPLNLAVAAFAIGHPAMFRRLGFAARERSAAPSDPGYGNSTRAKLSDLINPAPGTVILNGMVDADTYAPTPAAALKYVTAEITKALGAKGPK